MTELSYPNVMPLLRNNESFARLLEAVSGFSEAGDDVTCEADELERLAFNIKAELDGYFGLSNWYSNMLVQAIGAALEEYPQTVPCRVFRKVHSIMRHAGDSARVTHGDKPARPKLFPT